MTYRTPESLIRQIMSESHAPALKIPEPERVQAALSILAANGVKSAARQDENTITVSAAEVNAAANIMDAAVQKGVLQAKPQMVSAEAIPVPDHRPAPITVGAEPHPPAGGQTFGEAADPENGTPDDREETELNAGSVKADGKVELEPRSLNNRMQNQIKKIDESEDDGYPRILDDSIVTAINSATRGVTPTEILEYVGLADSAKFAERVSNLAEAGHFMVVDGKFTKNSPLVESVQQITEELITYPNTPAKAREIGWDRLPEHTIGDPKSKYVLHDHLKGKFHYTNDKGNLKEEVEQIDELSVGTLTKVANVARKKNRPEVLKAAIKAGQRKRNEPEYKFAEEVEQIDELSFGKLASYAKAGTEAVKRSTAIDKKTASRAAYVAKANEKKATKLSKAAFGEEAKSPVDTVLRILSEAGSLRLKATINSDCGKHHAKIYKDHEWNEHRVKFFIHGKHHEPSDYHTDDYEDAHGTAKHQLHSLSKLNGALKEAAEDGTSPFLSEGITRVASYQDSAGRKLTLHKKGGSDDQHVLVHKGSVISQHQGSTETVHKALVKDGLRHVNEEQLAEISARSAEEYMDHAIGSADRAEAGMRSKNKAKAAKADKTMDKRMSGLDNANAKLTGKARVNATEEVEQIDELSPATLTNYAIKAGHDRNVHAAKGAAKLARGNSFRTEPEVREKLHKDAGKHMTKANNRAAGAKKALSKIAQNCHTAGMCEEVELTEGKKDDVAAAKKHLFKLPIANEVGQSMHTAARHFNYVQDACDHVYSNHCKDLPYEDYDKIKPHLEDHFKAHGLK